MSKRPKKKRKKKSAEYAVILCKLVGQPWIWEYNITDCICIRIRLYTSSTPARLHLCFVGWQLFKPQKAPPKKQIYSNLSSICMHAAQSHTVWRVDAMLAKPVPCSSAVHGLLCCCITKLEIGFSERGPSLVLLSLLFVWFFLFFSWLLLFFFGRSGAILSDF